jgi:hypothetical protein
MAASAGWFLASILRNRVIPTNLVKALITHERISKNTSLIYLF